MQNFKGWNDLYRKARHVDLDALRFDTDAAMPLYDPKGKLLNRVYEEIAKTTPPLKWLSIGEGQKARIWAPIQTWGYSDQLLSAARKDMICVDPFYSNSAAIIHHQSEISKGCERLYWKPVIFYPDTTNPLEYTEPNLHLSVNYINGGIPATDQVHEEISKLVGQEKIWLNVINLLNYVPWEEFKGFIARYLRQINVVTFANHVNVDREIMNYMSSERMKSNEMFIEWMIGLGFEMIWQNVPDLIDNLETRNDMAAIFVRKKDQSISDIPES